ncbi:MAG: DUF2851 family protein [Flavobacteriaceae bacterium]
MKEDFLHYVWKHQKFPPSQLTTTTNEAVRIVHPGRYNASDGPDFLEAQIIIDGIKWVGSLEIHLKSSDWYRHNHQNDTRYDNVILHVVWEDDIDVCRRDGTLVPTLVLSEYIPQNTIQQLRYFFSQKTSFIPCEEQLKQMPLPLFLLWKERLYIERLETKSSDIQSLLKWTNNDWEGVLFILLARNFGLNINGEAFGQIAKSIPFSVVRKIREARKDLEALFLGQAGLVNSDTPTQYAKELWERFSYLRHKFSLPQPEGVRLNFSGLRPPNFPTIRWVQLAALYANSAQLFSKFYSRNRIQTSWLKEIEVSPFWETHYTFSKSSAKRSKPLSERFIDLLKINTLIPFYFSFEKAMCNDPSEIIIDWIREIKGEENTITQGFVKIGGSNATALDSQAYIHLKKNYCNLKKCLLCAVGVHLLNHS